MTKISEYKGYSIEFDEQDGRFYVPKKEEGQVIKVASAATMKEMKEAIDKLAKYQLLKVSVFIHPRDRMDEPIVKGKITSFRDSRYGYGERRQRKEFRVTWPSKRDDGGINWENVYPDRLYKDTPANVALILEYNKLIADAVMLREKAVAVREKMAVYSEKELLGE